MSTLALILSLDELNAAQSENFSASRLSAAASEIETVSVRLHSKQRACWSVEREEKIKHHTLDSSLKCQLADKLQSVYLLLVSEYLTGKIQQKRKRTEQMYLVCLFY